MIYSEFEKIISKERLAKYVRAMNNDTKKAMTLYRYNIELSQEFFSVISCFEVALRNVIDEKMKQNYGDS